LREPKRWRAVGQAAAVDSIEEDKAGRAKLLGVQDPMKEIHEQLKDAIRRANN
jgi:hypothetical protein